jgi:hypothetical protein
MNISDIVKAVDIQSVLTDVKDAGKLWMQSNASKAALLGKDTLQAVVISATIKSFPASVSDPEINIQKMQAAEKLMALAARHQKELDELEDSAREAINGAIKKAINRIAAAALKAIIFSAVV